MAPSGRRFEPRRSSSAPRFARGRIPMPRTHTGESDPMGTFPIAAVCCLASAGGLRAEPRDTVAVEIQWGVKIPLRDGIHLNATLYRPRGVTTPLPVIFTL